VNLLLAALPDFLGGLAAALTLATGRWALLALRGRRDTPDDSSA
jgi:hypothetical protein